MFFARQGRALLLSALLATVGTVQAQAQSVQTKPKAAVYIIGNPEGRDALRMAVNTFLIKSGKYQMVAVDAIDVVAAEQKRQMSGSVSDAQIAKLGQDAGAQYVCVVERSELDGYSYVATRMVSVESKVAEFADMVKLPYGSDIIELIQWQIGSMLGMAVGPRPGQTAQPPQYNQTYQTPAPSYRDREDNTYSYTAGGSDRSPAYGRTAPPPPPPPPPTRSSSGDAIACYMFGADNARNAEELAERVVDKLASSRKYSISRRRNSEFFMEMEKSSDGRGGLPSDRDICLAGRNFGVSYVCVIDIVKAGRGASIWGRIMDLSNCQIVGTAEFVGLIRNSAEIDRAANELSRELLFRRINKRSIITR